MAPGLSVVKCPRHKDLYAQRDLVERRYNLSRYEEPAEERPLQTTLS